MSPKLDDAGFYVGYQPRASAAIRSWIRSIVILLFVATFAIALTLILAQAPFAPAFFEWGVEKTFRGRLIEFPYPMLIADQGYFLLFGPGKHGVAELARGRDGATVELKGSRIGDDQALEVASLQILTNASASPKPEIRSLGRMTLTGEIVDTKCHYGVMNPGSGKVHRDCAVRCISGGVPPGFLVRDAKGEVRTLLLTGMVIPSLFDQIAIPVTLTGDLAAIGPQLIFKVDKMP